MYGNEVGGAKEDMQNSLEDMQDWSLNILTENLFPNSNLLMADNFSVDFIVLFCRSHSENAACDRNSFFNSMTK